jgi:hypothetical protein
MPPGAVVAAWRRTDLKACRGCPILGPVTSEALIGRPARPAVPVPPTTRPAAAVPALLLGRFDPPVAVTLTWVPLVLLLDRGAGIWWQRALGAGTWLLLAALLRRETPLVRAQVAVVVAFATVVEYTFSPLLEVYVYRLGNVPAFVPPGHGLVYLCALAIGRSAWVHRRTSLAITATAVVGGLYAAWALSGSRPDVLGAFWYLCLLGFLAWGRSRTLYVGVFVVVTYLELLGTRLGTWAWSAHDPTGLVSIGNPPSGAAGGYGWFDLAAVLAGPALLTLTHRLRSRARRLSGPGARPD